MARSFDPIQTINREVVKSDDVSLVLNELGLHALGYALPPGVPFKYVPTVSGGKKDEIIQEIQQIDVMAITPMDAMNKLFLLKEKARKI